MAVEDKKPSSRQRLTDRYRSSRPDINWDEEGDSYDVDGLAADELEKYDAESAKNKEANDRLNSLLGSDDAAASIFVGWSEGKDPVELFIEKFGDDFVSVIQEEGGKEKFKEALNKWRKGKQADSEHQKAYDANIEQSGRTLVEFADKHGLSDDEVKELTSKAWEFGSNVADGLYTEEMLEMVYKAGNYDTAVADSREEGRVEGKSENIRRELRQSKPATGLPPTSGGQDAVAVESAPKKPKQGNLGMFGGIPINRK